MTDVMMRKEDMSHDGQLMVCIEEDGDVIISVVPTEERARGYMPSVEFCSPGAGGGKSPHTRKALADLYYAIKKDNEENPT